jgi:hypothetical protein
MPHRIEQWLFVHHARVRQGERGITEDHIKDAVLNGRSWEQGQGAHGGVKWAFESWLGVIRCGWLARSKETPLT